MEQSIIVQVCIQKTYAPFIYKDPGLVTNALYLFVGLFLASFIFSTVKMEHI